MRTPRTGRLLLAIVALVALSACSIHPLPVSELAAKGPALQMEYTTMGIPVNAPGCGSWFWENWKVLINADGTFHYIVRNGRETVAEKSGKLSARRLRRLLGLVRDRASKLPDQLGEIATDTNFGTIDLTLHTISRHIEVQGAYAGDSRFQPFFRIAESIEAELGIRDPWC